MENSGLETIQRIWRDASGRVHHYLETLDGILIDPTWQQFLDPDISSKGLPKVLIARREGLEVILDRLGVRREDFEIWTDIEDKGPLAEDADEEWGWSRPADEGDNEEWGRWGWGDGQDDPLPNEEEQPIHRRPAVPYQDQVRPAVTARQVGDTIGSGVSILEDEARPTLIEAINHYELASGTLLHTLGECRARIAELSQVDHTSGAEAVSEAEAEIAAVKQLIAEIEGYLDHIERQRSHIEIAHYAIGRAADDVGDYRRAVRL